MEADVQLEKWDGAILSINAMVASIGSNCVGILATCVLCDCVRPHHFHAAEGKQWH